MRTVLVAGAAGFLGSHFVERCIAEGYRVIAIDDLSSGSLMNLEASGGSYEFFETDIISFDPRSVDEVDFVVNFASPASPSKYRADPLRTLRTNAEGTERLARCALSNSAVFLQASTSEVYGDPLIHPQQESYYGNVDPVGPRSCYDEGKRYAESLLTAYAGLGLQVRIARIFNTYGPRMDPYDGRVVPTLMRQAISAEPLTIHGDGSQTRSFCYVPDLIEGLWRLMHSDIAGPVNLGNPDEITMNDLADRIVSITGTAGSRTYLETQPGDPCRRKPDITRARTMLGWEPAHPLDDGLRETYRWMKNHLELLEIR